MSRDISKLHPWLQYKIGLLQKDCEKAGLKLGIGECYRSAAEQDALYAQGRTKPGRRVTNAKGSSYSSQHQWGVAFDVFQNVKGKEYQESFFRKVAVLAKKRGLAWGGNWKSFQDTPHFYLPKWGDTPRKLKSTYGNVTAFKKTWTATTKKNCKLWSKKTLRSSTAKCKISKGSKVEVLYRSKLGYAKVKYNGKYGFIFKSCI